MAEVTFTELVGIYRNTDFSGVGGAARVTIADTAILATLRSIDCDPEAAWLSQISTVDDLRGSAAGDVVRAVIRSPVQHLGILAQTFDDLLLSPRTRVREPSDFYVVAGGLSADMADPPPVLLAYRAVIAVVELLAGAASYLDDVQQELVFAGSKRMVLRIDYSRADLVESVAADASTLLGLFSDDLHRDQKLTILAETVVEACSSTSEDDRFRTLLGSLATTSRNVAAGYRSFAAEFSYAKIRRDVETAQFDYLGRIHKTFTDIQNQLLGIPVATFLVVSQMKPAAACGAELATDVAVVAGAWIYVVLVAIAVTNQLMTLHAIDDEVTHQRMKVARDHAAVIEDFRPVFDSLAWRIQAHRVGLSIIGVLAVIGAIAATAAENRLVTVGVGTCLTESRTDDGVDMTRGEWIRFGTSSAVRSRSPADGQVRR